MLMDFLERFATRYGNLIEALRAGLADGDGDPKAVARQLHQLRGFAANFGALGVVRGARMLEEALLRGDDPRPEEWAELEDQIRIVIDASAPWRQALDQPMGQARSKITAPPAPA
jgi:HPt (histidine-containing phosphotransfer) domain-containing protein